MTTDDLADWLEVESLVHRPQRWVLFLAGAFFLALGVIFFVEIGPANIAWLPGWVPKAFTSIFIILGAAICLSMISESIAPARVLHASPDVLPNVPTEPVIEVDSIVPGRFTHELIEDADGWQFRPAGVAAEIGGPAYWFTWTAGGSDYRRLCQLRIGKDGVDLELVTPQLPVAKRADYVIAGFRWILSGETGTQHLRIPREIVTAVQLCPWKVVVSRSGERTIINAVQGLLVLTDASNGGYFRIPILLSSDYARAARLMQQLARVLHVPFLYCADANGWKAELLRAKTR
jgi:hypothetical protein